MPFLLFSFKSDSLDRQESQGRKTGWHAAKGPGEIQTRAAAVRPQPMWCAQSSGKPGNPGAFSRMFSAKICVVLIFKPIKHSLMNCKELVLNQFVCCSFAFKKLVVVVVVAGILFSYKMVLSVLQFYEGYGQTECTAGCSMSMPGDWTAGKPHSLLNAQ